MLGAADDHPNPSLPRSWPSIRRRHRGSFRVRCRSRRPANGAQRRSTATEPRHLGAPDILLDRARTTTDSRLSASASITTQAPVVGSPLASSSTGLAGESLPTRPRTDRWSFSTSNFWLPSSATIAYFGQGVLVKVISGDSPVTVGAATRSRARCRRSDRCADASGGSGSARRHHGVAFGFRSYTTAEAFDGACAAIADTP